MFKLPPFEKLAGAVAVDLDGTLFNNRTEVSERNRKALESCLRAGLPVIIATSRAERSVRRRFETALYERLSVVLSNGAIARGVPPLEGNVDIAIPKQTAVETIRVIRDLEPEAQVTVEIRGWEFGMNRRPDARTLWEINSATPEMLLSVEEAIERGPHKIAVGGLPRDLKGLAGVLSAEFRGQIEVVPGNDGTFLNIIGKGVSKSGALAALLSSRGISLSDVLAFGDDSPDLDLLANCGYPVAMANASPDIKKAAKYETVSNEEDGVALVLEKMLEKWEKKSVNDE
jgi:Cof subfamily protein (haloacid dehalogenase superfamily)